MDDLFEVGLLILFFVFPYLRDLFRKARERSKKRAARKTQPAKQKPQTARSKTRQGLPKRSTTTQAKGSGVQARFEKKLVADAEALLRDAQTLLARAVGDERTSMIVDPLNRELVQTVQAAHAQLTNKPSIATLTQTGGQLRALESLHAYAKMIVDQRLTENAAYLGDADKLAETCYAPLLQFVEAHSIAHKTMHPLTVHGAWDMSIVLELASSSIAPLRVPNDFGRSLWLWPAIAHEIAHDIYFGVTGLQESLLARLHLPTRVTAPQSASAVDEEYLRTLFGPWMLEVFADVLGTLMLGPASVETMRRAFARPEAPLEAAAIMTSDRGHIARHPPPTLRVHMACEVLHYLGRHQEADDHWDAWTAAHPSEGLFFLPVGHAWAGFEQSSLMEASSRIVQTLLTDPWPELASFHLIDIPGLTYLHAEHADVVEAMPALLAGRTVDEEARLVIAAAVLAAANTPHAHDAVLGAALRSIHARGEARPDAWDSLAPSEAATKHGSARHESFHTTLRRSLATRSGQREAVVLGALLNRPRH